MKWLEFIRVRSAGSLEKSFHREISRQVAELSNTPGLLEARVYDHSEIPGDLCVTLSWETHQPAPGGSSPGLALAGILKKVGMVAHSVWIESLS